MTTDVFDLSTVVAAVSCGFMAGLLFAFSGSVIGGLGAIEEADSIRAMNAMNTTLLNPFFGAMFFGGLISSVVLVAWASFDADLASRTLIFVGGGCYVIGVFAVTVVFNVPMNNRLADHDLTTATTSDIWMTYSRRWLLLNHLRTLSAVIASGSFAFALVRHGSGS